MPVELLINVLSIFDLNLYLIEVILIVYVQNLPLEEHRLSWGMSFDILMPRDAAIFLPELAFLGDEWLPAALALWAPTTFFADIIPHTIISVHLTRFMVWLVIFIFLEIYS